MKQKIHRLFSVALLLLLSLNCWQLVAAVTNPTAVTNLINRIGGAGAANRFVTIVDESLASNGQDKFIISSQDGKPCIKGNNTLAVTTGLNWYLNHHAHINLAWNNLTTDLNIATLPLPSQDETHSCNADYRYYLNYCTFSYSMSVWTWDRWQKEIDWMALHGINMPLQIVGLDVVWKNLLTKDLGYRPAEANNFIAGPCFQAWWGMNNLQGWGGPNPDWWYTRQESLAKKILARERELGMQPVLPGYAGMAPSDITSKAGIAANNQGNWCSFLRPYILNPNSEGFTKVAALYYKRLEELMGTSEYYSIDPFHEGANTDGIDVPSAYTQLANALYKANADAKWVIQQWQWSDAQYNVLSKVEKGKLIILDLYSEANPNFGAYKDQNGQYHDAVYCNIPNFGGRTGLFGRLTKVLEDYFSKKQQYPNIKGVGATPEAIEQVPVLYDALYELPWYTSAPNAKTWLANYTVARYGTQNEQAQQAWEQIRNSALNCQTGLQGPQEAVLCARPSLTVGSVSTWGGTEIFYDAQQVIDAAYKMLQAKGTLSGQNFSYDLTDFTRQAFTDYANFLLKAINEAATKNDTEAYAQRRDAYLQLILDLDELLNTNQSFMLGRWTNLARGIADEASGTTESDKRWLELNNARTLITTWGDRDAAEYGGLRDYSYREWGGMLKDFYYKRWKAFFDARDNGSALPNWFENDRSWAQDASLSYSNQPTGNTADVASKLFTKYFITLQLNNGSNYHLFRYMNTDLSKSFVETAMRGETYTMPITLPQGLTATLGIDYNNDGTISSEETSQGLVANIPSTALTSKVKAQLTLSDGTELKFSIVLRDNIIEARTISVKTADVQQGSVTIEGTEGQSVTNTSEVTVKAVPTAGYDFANWTNAEGSVVSTDNPYTYYGAKAETFTANFLVNKWGSPTEDLKDMGDIKSHAQYVSKMTTRQNGGEEESIYSADVCPSSLFHTTQIVTAAKGSELTIHWTGAGGLNYCNLSAYADWNADGTFNDADELVATYGTKSSDNNGALNDYTLKVLLPYDATEGLTHIRLRFDGAWQSGYNGNGAMPAKAATMRMVYDIPVNVTAYANKSCTVTVRTSDVKRGTVDANGQADTYTYKVGEDVILRCYAADGYKLDYWADQYGRKVPAEWYDGTAIRFKAAESGTYTAYFTPNVAEEIVCGDWKFNRELSGDNIILTRVAQAGEGELTIPATYDGHKIIAMKAGALADQKKVTSVSLSKNILSLGSADNIESGNFKGEGTTNALIPLNHTLRDGTTWHLHADVTHNGASLNEWGSAILATGTEALAENYYKGFQFYQSAIDGSLILKTGNESDGKHVFNCTKGVKNYAIDVHHTQENTLTFSVDNGQEVEQYTLINHSLNDIAQFSTALPKGFDINSYSVITSKALPYRNKLSDVVGAKVENALIDPQQTLDADEAWRITFDVESDGSTFNEWGSGLFATGNGALEKFYNNGFQLYLKKDKGSLILKTNGEHETEFTICQGLDRFKVMVNHDTDANLTVTVATADKSESHTIEGYTALNDITQFATAIPVGVNLRNLKILNASVDPSAFRGCTALKSVTVAENNPCFTANEGVVYTDGGHTLHTYPAGRVSHAFTLPSEVTRIRECAFTTAIELDRLICSTATPAEGVADDFTEATFYVQVQPAQAAAYQSAWGGHLLFSVDKDQSLSAQQTTLLTDQDAVNLDADKTQSGVAEGVKSAQGIWLTTTFAENETRPLYFPTKPERITVDGLSVSQTPVSTLTTYQYNDGKFIATQADVSEGACLVSVPNDWANKTVTIRFAAPGQNETLAEGFVGNGTTTLANVSDKRCYQYNEAEDIFYLQPTESQTMVNPLAAVFTSSASQPAKAICGPNAHLSVTLKRAVGIDDIDNIATFSAPFDVVIPNELTAWIVSQSPTTSVLLQQVDAKVLPANTGFLLTSSLTAATVRPATADDAPVAEISYNVLGHSAGEAKTLTPADNAYILALAPSTQTLAFCRGKVGSVLPMNRSYLAYPAQEAAIALVFGGSVMGIGNATTWGDKDATPIYDLTGRRVIAPVKGSLYIKNGHKFIAL